MKRFRAAVLMLLMAALWCIPVYAAEDGGTGLTKDVKILYTSDVHCAIDEGGDTAGSVR